MDDSISNSSATETADLSGIFAAVRGIELLLLASTVWIFVCTLIYGYKTKKWRKKSASTSLDRGIIFTCCVGAIALSLPRLTFTTVMLFIPAYEIKHCEQLMDTSNGLHFCSVYPTYFFLWLRQKAIYSHPAAKRLIGKGKCWLPLNWGVLFVLSVSSIALTCAFIVPDSYVPSVNGCVHANAASGEGDGKNVLYYILAGFSALCQVIFLALFVYPMIKCRITRKASLKRRIVRKDDDKVEKISIASRTGSKFTSETQRFLQSRHKSCQNSNPDTLSRTIRRSVISTSVAIVSDVIAMALVSFAFPTNIPRILTDSVYDLSIVANNLSILATFGGNRHILTALCTVIKRARDGDSRKAFESTSHAAQGQYQSDTQSQTHTQHHQVADQYIYNKHLNYLDLQSQRPTESS